MPEDAGARRVAPSALAAWVGLGALALAGALALGGAFGASLAADRVAHSQAELRALGNVERAQLRAFDREHAFLATNDTLALQAAHAAEARTDAALAALVEFTRDGEAQQRRLEALTRALHQVRAARAVATSARARGIITAHAVEDDPDWVAGRAAIERIVGEMVQDEERVLAERSARQHTSERLLDLSIAVALVVAGGFGAWSLRQLRRDATELAQSEARYRSLAAQSPDAVLVHAEGRVVYANAASARLLGESDASAVIGRPMEGLLRLAVDRATPATGSAAIRPAQLRRRDGVEIEVEVSEAPVAFGHQAAVEVLARDVRERRAIEAGLLRVQQMDAMGRMASGAAHDVNNLLAVIRSSADTLALRGLDEFHVRESLDAIRGAVGRAAALTQELLAFSSRRHATPRPLSLAQLVQRDQALLERLVGPTVSLVVEVAPDAEGALIDADVVQVEQVLFNLVANARDAMVGQGEIRVRVGVATLREPEPHLAASVTPGPYVTLAVQDDGEGMAADVLSHVFEPYFTTKKQGHGTGLGLSTVYGVLQQHRGAVTVESAPGRGSCFVTWWPRASDAAVVEAPEEEMAPVATDERLATAGRSLLVVDDDVVVLRVLEMLLVQLGHTVRAASSGRAALAIMEREGRAIEAIVTDVRMPGMSGVEMVATLLRRGVSLPVLFVSGQLDAPIPTSWDGAVRWRFLSKPFTAGALAAALESLFARGRATPASPAPAVERAGAG